MSRLRVLIVALITVSMSYGCQEAEDTVDADGDGWKDEEDCGPDDASTHPGADDPYGDGIDQDCDMCPSGSPPVAGDGVDRDCDAYPANADIEDPSVFDCDDADPAAHPGAQDIPNDGIDQDCSGEDFVDADLDGHAAGADDCDDEDPNTYLDAPELADCVDNDCDDQVDESLGTMDEDGDGYCAGADMGQGLACCDGDVQIGDCDDQQPQAHPGGEEICDAIDNDCNGDADGEFDLDGDGTTICGPDGMTGTADDDCDDDDAAVFPGATEACNGIDDDCDGAVPATEFDFDGDGLAPCDGDCDDSDRDIRPGAQELCDSIDNDCDPATDEWVDGDGDGYSVCLGDCDDAYAQVNPDATEFCDLIDNDCDGDIDEGFVDDLDGDGWSTCQGDCDDDNWFVHPGADEICDGVDTDCDGTKPLDDVDSDQDGYAICAGDCDDNNPLFNPGAVDLCGGGDENCDGMVDHQCQTPTFEVPGDYATIQEAIDAAVDGDSIAVYPGTYPENIDLLGKLIGLYGAGGAGATTIDGGGLAPVVSVTSGEGIYTGLAGFTLTNGHCPENSCAGGILIEDSSATLLRLVIRDSATDSGGEGISVYHGEVQMEAVDLIGNTTDSSYGGAAGFFLDAQVSYVGGRVALNHTSPWYSAGLVFEDSTAVISGIESFANSGGASGIEASSSDIAIEGATFTGNEGSDAAGLYCRYSTCDLANAEIFDNNSAESGGAIRFQDTTGVMSNVRVGRNHAVSDGALALVDGSTLNATNLAVLANSADDQRGGIILEDSMLTLDNSVLVAANGSALNVDGTSTAWIVNTVFAWNAGGDGAIDVETGGSVLVHYCDMWGNSPADVDGMPDPVGLFNNLGEEPAFLQTVYHPGLTDPRNWDLHLALDSPLVDAGENTIFDPDQGPSDMGIYGGPSGEGWDLDRDGYYEWWLPGSYDSSSSPSMDCADQNPAIYPGAGC